MLLYLKEEASESDVNNLMERLKWMGLVAKSSGHMGAYTVAILEGIDKNVDRDAFSTLPMVKEVRELKHAFKLASKTAPDHKSQVRIKDVAIGSDTIAIMAGPCSIESKDQMDTVAAYLAEKKVQILRGGAYKPRTSPYSFQGLGEEGMKFMKEAADKYNLVTISEVMEPDQIPLLSEYVDILQVGTRNMQNFSLLKHLGKIKNPIFLKRGLSATYQDFLMSAEYILGHGNPNVILCERGIRTYETHTRNTLDIAAVPILQELSHLPVIVDPSHAAGIRKMVRPLSKAAVAAGADGLMIEMHPNPDEAFSDKDQTIDFDEFAKVIKELKPIAKAVGKTVL
ncbi:MAG: Phospho-2-dehydro-3-deoxyheptonate aldolase [Chlamydiia bacterium]|nr:Phospho-2-dehydro-3-deoxyheptonate aldolase [Chlamydiia bacterium]